MLYGDYIKESFGRSIIECDDGFVTYKFIDTVCHVDTLYVRLSMRNTGVGKRLFGQVLDACKAHGGIDLIVCEIDPLSMTCNETMEKFLRYGFKILDCHREQVRMYLRVGAN